jgi:hypothetical protein
MAPLPLPLIVRALSMGLSKVKINSNMANKPKKWLPKDELYIRKNRKCYSVKEFMSYTVYWANEYFIISFVLSHLFILFSLIGPLSFIGYYLLLLLRIGDGDGAVCDFALMCWCCSGFDDFL